MSNDEIKPVAWVDFAAWLATNDAGDSFFTDYQDDDTVAVYDQSDIDRLTAERDALRSQLDWTVRENDRLLDEGRDLAAKLAEYKEDAERGAWLIDCVPVGFLDRIIMIACAKARRAAIDAARKGVEG